LNKYVLFPSPNRLLQVVSHTFGVEAHLFSDSSCSAELVPLPQITSA
jgi:hypothetical protein